MRRWKERAKESDIFQKMTVEERRMTQYKHWFNQSSSAGVAFFVGISTGQVVLARFGVTAAYPKVVNLMAGMACVCVSMVAAGRVSDAVKNINRGLPVFQGVFAEAEDNMIRDCLVGGTIFFLLGGRFRSVLASDLCYLGAYARREFSLPATLDYATAAERMKIQIFGKRQGCHSCGTRKSETFIADHQPPIAIVKRETSSSPLFRKIFPMTQRFFPQCLPCSQRQGQSLLTNPRKIELIYHFDNLRAFHFAGLFLLVSRYLFDQIIESLQTLDTSTEVPAPVIFSPVQTKIFLSDEEKLERLRLREKEIKYLLTFNNSEDLVQELVTLLEEKKKLKSSIKSRGQ
jgi:hypothetical protein